MAGRLMLEHKGIAYRRVDLIPALHKPILRVAGFRDTTVPALRIDGRKLQHTVEISRALDELQPDPPLFPAPGTPGPRSRRPSAGARRRCSRSAAAHVVGAAARPLADAQHGAGRAAARAAGPGDPTAQPIVWIEARINDADDSAIQADLAALPALLDRVDALLAAACSAARR